MKTLSSVEIRKAYLDYFAARGHAVRPSDGLVPSGDPTLLFTSAGMVQFKKHFLGQSADTFTRAATCQKCFRTSDIDQVGVTNRHLTFFEMLGNFSFGDYFKQDAIAWGWDFLTKEMGLPGDRLYATVYKDDDEAFALWERIVPRDRIIRMGEDTNFWNMGPTGPCGPCSELLFDLGPALSCGRPDCGPACSCNRYLEVWNLVFTQFDRQADGSLKNLPRKNIDTGMGLERLVAVVQGKDNVFDTDLFRPLMLAAAQALGIAQAKVDDPAYLPKLRMMADHLRAITLLIGDGILPSNEGRGYVLRRILRRALRQGKLFGAEKPFLHALTAAVVAKMAPAYPELSERAAQIASIARQEEERFLETLAAGTQLLDDIIARHRRSPDAARVPIDGSVVFKLYDTYGFPFDLTREIVAEAGFQVNEQQFKDAQRAAQERSRAAWAGSGEQDTAAFSALHKKLGATVFTGYDRLTDDAVIAAVLSGTAEVPSAADGEFALVLDRTPFYAESGGQVADHGRIVAGTAVAEVLDVQKPVDGLFIHRVRVTAGSFAPGMRVSAVVDAARRADIMRHHTATHLLHRALREVLGGHATQAGSLVTPEYFRFDFAQPTALSAEQLSAAQRLVNEAVRANMPVCIESMSIEDARTKGAMALFGEKYGTTVRTVTVQDPGAPVHSMELCGGTHVHRTGDIGVFLITGESSVAAGVRRIEGVAGRAAEAEIARRDRTLSAAAAALKTAPAELPARIAKLTERVAELEREIERMRTRAAAGGLDAVIAGAAQVGGVRLATAALGDVDARTLRDLADAARGKIGSGIIILSGTTGDKLSFIVTLTPDVQKQGYSAGAIAKNFAAIIGGSGGGKPDFAQGGGKASADTTAAFAAIAGKLK